MNMLQLSGERDSQNDCALVSTCKDSASPTYIEYQQYDITLPFQNPPYYSGDLVHAV